MRKVIPKNIADEMTKPYIDEAVEKQIKAADVPPRNKLNISFENADRTDDNKEYKSNQEAYEKNHGKLYDMTHNNTIPWKNYVVYLVLLSLLTTVFTFSKYLSGANGNTSASIAKFNVVTSYNLDDKDFEVTPTETAKDLIFLEDEAGPKSIPITVTSDSEVSVKVTVKQTNSAFATFNETKTIAYNADDKTVTFNYSLARPSTDGKSLTTDKLYYVCGQLNFDVKIEQVD